MSLRLNKSGKTVSQDEYLSTWGQWDTVKAGKVKKGQCILGKHHQKVNEAIDLLLMSRSEDWKSSAKKNSAERGHYCIVMSKPEKVEQNGEQVEIEVLYCTKSAASLFAKEINVPFPHSSKLYMSYNCKREPLKVEDDSSEFNEQTYVVPYETFVLTYGATEEVKVYHNFRVLAEGINQLVSACKGNQSLFAKIRGMTEKQRTEQLEFEKAQEDKIRRKHEEEQRQYEKDYKTLQAEGQTLTEEQRKQIQSWQKLKQGPSSDEPKSFPGPSKEETPASGQVVSWASITSNSGKDSQSDDKGDSTEPLRKLGKATLTFKKKEADKKD